MGMIVDEDDMINVKSTAAGIYRQVLDAGDEARRGDVLARVIHPYEGEILAEITAPADGVVFFAHKKPLVTENSMAFKMIKRIHK